MIIDKYLSIFDSKHIRSTLLLGGDPINNQQPFTLSLDVIDVMLFKSQGNDKICAL